MRGMAAGTLSGGLSGGKRVEETAGPVARFSGLERAKTTIVTNVAPCGGLHTGAACSRAA